jgi:hypothetical protein
MPMVYYVFERVDEVRLTDGVTRQIVKEAGYAEARFSYDTYDLDDKKIKVAPNAPNAPDMAVPTLEHASRTKVKTAVNVKKYD